MIRNQKRLQLNWSSGEPKSSREMRGEVKLSAWLLSRLYILATYSNRGAKEHKARVNCDLTVSKTERNTHHTLQLSRRQGFYIIRKLLSIFFNHLYLTFIFNLHLASTDSEKGNFLAGTFSILFPQNNCENEVWAPIHNQWRESIRDLVLQQLGHFTNFHGRVMDRFSSC